MTITVDDLRSYLGIGSYTGNDDNPHLKRALDAATTAVGRYTGRTFTAPGDTGTVRVFRAPRMSAGPLYVDDFVDDPTTITESSDRTSWSTVTDDWFTGPDNLTTRYVIEGRYWDRHVRVTAKWGVDSTLIAEAELPTLMKAARIYKRRDSVSGVEGFGEFGVVRITRASDPDIAELLDPLVRMDRVGIA